MNYTKINFTQVAGVDVESLPSSLAKHFPRFRRAPFSNGRYYFNNTDPFFYSGLTGPIGYNSDKRHLNKAAINMAYQGRSADFEWNERANYGTCFHLLVGLHEDGSLPFVFGDGDWRKVVQSFIEEYRYHEYAARWYSDIQNDFAAYFQWKQDSEVKVLSTEVVVSSQEWKIATPLDLIVEMKFNRKRILANVNIKTGDHPFPADNLLQVGMEAYLWNQCETRPFDIEGTFAWRPKSRATSPGAYELSKNCMYTEDNIPLYNHIGNSVNIFGLNNPSGKIVTFEGDEQSFKIQTLSPWEWLEMAQNV